MKVKMQQIKRIVSKSLVVAIIIVTLFGSNNCYAKATSSKSPNFSSAKEIENFLSRPKKNIHFIDGSYSSLKNKYICTCDNYSLKICEKTNNNTVYSRIYIKENKSYKYLARLKTSIKGQNITYKFITPYGKLTRKESFERPAINYEQKSLSNEKPGIYTMDSYDGMKVSGWKYYGTFKYSTKFKKYTVTAVGAAVGAVIGTSSLGVGAAVAASVSAQLIQQIINEHIKVLYYTDKVYYKTVIPPKKWMVKQKVAEKDIFYMYKNSTRTKSVKGSPKTVYHYKKGYKH